MAELIDRNSLLANLNKFAPEHFNALVNDLIKKEPISTTEAEIIEKFAEQLGEEFSENSSEINVDGNRFDILTLDSVIEIMWDLAEQLKGE